MERRAGHGGRRADLPRSVHRGGAFPTSSRIVDRERIAFDRSPGKGTRMADKDWITLSVEDGPTVDAARAATTLARELVREGIRVTTVGGSAPEGTKSGIIIAAGTMIISGAVSAQAIRSTAQIVMAAMRRGLAGRIHLEDGGRKIDVENASRDTERALVAWLNASSAPGPDGE